MKPVFQHGTAIAGILFLLSTCSSASAGDLRHVFGLRSGCNCSSSAHQSTVVVPTVHAAPVVHMVPDMQTDCCCSAAISSCCGIGGGLVQLGNLYSVQGILSSSEVHHGAIGADQFAYDQHSGFPIGNSVSGGGLTGFEGLPNMDGGGINHRYPYHSYRRPWAHPGPQSTNVSIVW